MRMSVRIGLTAVVLMALVPSAFAQSGKARRKAAPAKEPLVEAMSGQGYGYAGCGLGSIAFGPKPGPVQIVAATLNGLAGQTFAITTGTSNCDIPQMGAAAAQFIEINQEKLRTDVARGEGETVSSLAYLLKCNDSALFGEKMRANSPAILEDGISSFETTRRILKTIETDAQLKTTCEQLG